MEEKILTKHPTKNGFNINRAKYDDMRKSIIESLSGKELTFTELVNSVQKKLKGRFDGSVAWYAEL